MDRFFSIKYFPFILFIFLSLFAKSQEKKESKPVRKPFSAASFINTQTVVGLSKKTFSFDMQHRFGEMTNGYSDMLGIFGASNIRIGLRYGITKNISIGLGVSKNRFLHDANIKYVILRQTRSGSIPISVSYYGNATAETRKSDIFKNLMQRFSYSNQLIFSRKINRLFLLGLSANYVHFNIVDSALYKNIKHDNFGISSIAKARIKGNMSFIVEYDFPFSNMKDVKQNLGFGIDISTATHNFQIFVSNYNSLSNQYNLVYNFNDFTKGEFFIGFNISKTWHI